MKIFLKQLVLTNFKGIRSLKIECDQVTNVYGQNGTGKTTLMDAFLWLFFGKDSSDRKDFEIKTLDENNNPYRRLDHEVSAIILVDGEEINIRRQYKEKWTKKRGSLEADFTGHETNFFWNDVPCNQKEYEVKVAGIVNEGIFKLLTNTTYFNSLKWEQRRNALLQIAGTINDADVFSTLKNKGDFSSLITALNAKKSLDEYKREIASKKKLIKEQMESLPARISENNRQLPEEKDYSAVESLLKDARLSLEEIDALLMNKTEAQKAQQKLIGDKIREAGQLKNDAGQIEFTIRNSVADKKNERSQVILNHQRELKSMQDDLSRIMQDQNREAQNKATLEADAESLRKQWHQVDAEVLKFDEADFSCPACKRAYETANIEETKQTLIKNFNADKSKRLSSITERGTKLKSLIEISAAAISNLKKAEQQYRDAVTTKEMGIEALQAVHTRICANEDQEIANEIAANETYKSLQDKIKLLHEEINAPAVEDNNGELLAKKKELQLKIDDLKSQLSSKDLREKILARITELQDQESKLAQEMATFEGIEYSILQFEKAKMEELERRVNDKFKIVKFKLFEEQINGGEVPCCITLINGVPFPDANTASKIGAGLDIINTLSRHYNVSAPIFIDNRESVINIPESESQIINLIVSADHKKLTVGNGVKEMAMA